MLRWFGLTAAAVLVAMGLTAASAQESNSEQGLREAVDALFSGDEMRVDHLLRFTMVGCVAEITGPGDPVECPRGVEPGTEIEAFPVAACEGGYLRPDQLGPIVELLAAPGPEVVAVYRVPEQSFFYGDYVVVATLSENPAPNNAGGVWLDGGRIAGVHTGCAQSPEAFAEFFGLTEEVDLTGSPGVPSTGSGSGSGSAGGPDAWLIAAGALLAAAGGGLVLVARRVRRG